MIGVYVGDVNAVLTFRDQHGREWVAAAVIGELVRLEGGAVVEQVPALEPGEYTFALREFKMVERS